YAHRSSGPVSSQSVMTLASAGGAAAIATTANSPLQGPGFISCSSGLRQCVTLFDQYGTYGRASRIMLNGVSAARRTLLNPPEVMTSRSLASPACAPSVAPTSWDREVGKQTIVDPA